MKSRTAPAKWSRAAVAALWLGALAPLLSTAAAEPSPHQIVITSSAVEPAVLTVATGERVDFVNRAQPAVHVEFGDDIRQHEVVQFPATGPIWAVFHRPGTHPYVVHIYGARTTALSGLVEVVEDPARPFGPGTCGAVVMGECLEP